MESVWKIGDCELNVSAGKEGRCADGVRGKTHPVVGAGTNRSPWNVGWCLSYSTLASQCFSSAQLEEIRNASGSGSNRLLSGDV